MKSPFLLFLFIFPAVVIYSQTHGTGALLDSAIFENCPRAPVLLTRDITDLPKKVSLRKFAPTPGDQGSLSTCSGWAVAYSARTIVAAIQNNWKQSEIDSNTFSPSFIYNQIRTRPGCDAGASIVQGLALLKNEGVAKLKDFSYDCNLKVKDDLKKLASVNKIKEYRTIAYGKTKNKVVLVKKSLSQNNPVIIAINCPDSFQSAGKVWIPDSTDYKNNFSGHALVVIGYDDDKYGGAFEVINSWGKSWGINGFSWIRYYDFLHFCVWAGEEIPGPLRDNQAVDLSGSLLFTLSSGKIMELKHDGKYITTSESYTSGTRFNLILTNRQPAYVYAIGSDLRQKCNVIFPFNDKINPYLPYNANDIALPGEGFNFQLDKTSGKTYFCFLYSPAALNIAAIADSIEKASGDFYDKVQGVLGQRMEHENDMKLNPNGEISFITRSEKKQIVVLLVEISQTE